jgi:hypothetical protein
MNTVAYHCLVCKSSSSHACEELLHGARGALGVGGCSTPDPLSQSSFTLLEDIRLGVMRGAGYKTCGVELAERTPSGLDDTELRLLNSIHRRKRMAAVFRPSRGETGLSSLRT